MRETRSFGDSGLVLCPHICQRKFSKKKKKKNKSNTLLELALRWFARHIVGAFKLYTSTD